MHTIRRCHVAAAQWPASGNTAAFAFTPATAAAISPASVRLRGERHSEHWFAIDTDACSLGAENRE
jgi:hypothetical protein